MLLLLLQLPTGGSHLKTESAPGQPRPRPEPQPAMALGNACISHALARHFGLASFVFTACILYRVAYYEVAAASSSSLSASPTSATIFVVAVVVVVVAAVLSDHAR